eukprot:scaffold5988_cov381-Prasinococcus_capsulatus_cf.AAC.11
MWSRLTLEHSAFISVDLPAPDGPNKHLEIDGSELLCNGEGALEGNDSHMETIRAQFMRNRYTNPRLACPEDHPKRTEEYNPHERQY